MQLSDDFICQKSQNSVPETIQRWKKSKSTERKEEKKEKEHSIVKGQVKCVR